MKLSSSNIIFQLISLPIKLLALCFAIRDFTGSSDFWSYIRLYHWVMMTNWWWIVFAEWLTDERCLRLISSRDHCQRFSLSQISDTPQAGFEPAQNLSSDFVEWSCAVVITTRYTTSPLVLSFTIIREGLLHIISLPCFKWCYLLYIRTSRGIFWRNHFK